MTKREKGAELYILSLINNSPFKDTFFTNKTDVQIMKWYAHFFGSYNPKIQKSQKALYMRKINEYRIAKNSYELEKGELLYKISKCPKTVFDTVLKREVSALKKKYGKNKEKYIPIALNNAYTRAVYNEYTLQYDNEAIPDNIYTETQIREICNSDNKRFYQALENNTYEKFTPTRL